MKSKMFLFFVLLFLNNFFYRELNLVNVHLFHDPSNIEAVNKVNCFILRKKFFN